MHRNAVFLVMALMCSALLAGGLVAAINLPDQACPNLLGTLQGDNLSVFINGTRLTAVIPSKAGQSSEDDIVVHYQWTDISQLQRTGSRCIPSKNLVIEKQLLSACNCTMERFETIENHVNTTGYRVTVFGCPTPQEALTLQAILSISNATSVVTYNNTMEYSVIDSFSYTTPKGGLKFGFHLNNWTWNDYGYYGVTNQSYLSLGNLFGFQTPHAFGVAEVLGLREYNLSAKIQEANIVMKMDVGALFDGIPAVARGERRNSDGDDTNATYVPIPAGAASDGFIIPLPTGFCQPVPRGDAGFLPIAMKQWNAIYYDPSLQVLFASPDNKSSSTKWVIPVVVVLVLVAVVGILLIVFFVKPVRNFVMPYNKDKVKSQRVHEHHQHNVEESTSSHKDNRWTRAAKPDMDQ